MEDERQGRRRDKNRTRIRYRKDSISTHTPVLVNSPIAYSLLIIKVLHTQITHNYEYLYI